MSEWRRFLASQGFDSTEQLLASEGMPAAGKRDPASVRTALQLPDDDEIPAGWPRRATVADPSIGPDLADARLRRDRKAFEIPGFFARCPQRGVIWRLVRLEGRSFTEVAALTGRSRKAVSMVVVQVEARLIRALEANRP
jgi:hypothetical protein